MLAPSAKRRARGRRGQRPRNPFPRRSGLGAARDAPAPPEGQKLQRADPRKGGNDTKRGFCVTAQRLAQKVPPVLSLCV